MAPRTSETERGPAAVPAWVERQDEFDSLTTTLAAEPAYALDTEFHRERTYFPKLALLQLGWPGGIAVVDALAVDVTPLADRLTGGGTAVLHAADQDLEVLDHACGSTPTVLFDTQVAAGFLGFASPSLSTLAERLLGIHLPKGDRLTDWMRRPLSAAQLSYAASDVAHLLELRDLLCARLGESDRLEWAEKECQELLVRPRGVTDPDRAWWRVKDARRLRGASRGVAQVVAAWRERRAQALDRPTRFVLSDMALLGVANNPPRDRGQLGAIRGIEGRLPPPPVVDELLAAVARGQQLDERELCLPPVERLEPELRPAVALAGAWIAQLARDLGIDGALLGTRGDVEDLLRGDPGARLARGWRAELVGNPVLKLAKGSAAVVFDGRGGLLLEERSGRPLIETEDHADPRTRSRPLGRGQTERAGTSVADRKRPGRR